MAEVAAEHHHGGEVADHPLRPRVIAAEDRGADADVPLAAVAGEQRLERGQQHHEQRAALGSRQRLEPVDEVGRQVEGELFAAAGTHRRAGAVGRQVQDRRAGQLLGPVGERGGVVAALGLADVVEVAELKRRQGRGFARRVRPVERGELAQEQFDRPAVGRDVVQHEAEHVIVGGEPDEGEPQHRGVFEVEGAVGALGDDRPGARRRVRPAGQVDHLESGPALR